MKYKHTQIGYLMLIIILAVLVFFVRVYTITSSESLSVDSGPNFLITSIMTLVLIILSSFVLLQVIINEEYIQIKFGYGIFKKRFLLEDVVSAKAVRNHWYYGWGIRMWLWPKMWIYNVSGFDAVEIKLKTGKTFRIGTDEPQKLEQTILDSLKCR